MILDGITVLSMDGCELELTCPCGYENFERVVVERRAGNPIVTDFVLHRRFGGG